ncbi:PREDICTED: DCN1-like protein 3 [Amphimedon queenslandica]|uniref:Defective in cullin neddylation protein n=1 Tax=Amphimedon queenslandica TaxID=400682 RepID=A0A1X7VSW2_AMPQE|nr:PREDICTED: DCN1-like protein 3 [Amphimedon queenslandica]|eukprot:XP_003382898.3 PREDICTED: DCN1-like protein 3 [Amphimedon queenslandica]
MGQKGSKDNSFLGSSSNSYSKTDRPTSSSSNSHPVSSSTPPRSYSHSVQGTQPQQRHTDTTRPPAPLPPRNSSSSLPPPPLPDRRSRSSTSSIESLNKFFQKYKDETEDAILAAGMERFCQDLGVDPTDFVVLVLAWKFQAEEMCRFTREEFVNGCQRLTATDASSLKKRFPDLVRETKESSKSFRELYNFTFSFGLDHGLGQRTLPVDMAIPLWELVFTYKTPPLLERWFQFLRDNSIQGISRDTWNMFLPFVTTVQEDFSNYDESEAWPSLFDDFVEQELEKSRAS